MLTSVSQLHIRGCRVADGVASDEAQDEGRVDRQLIESMTRLVDCDVLQSRRL